ncbi:MAG: hypothetical protein H6717_24705 [Polyangiaceae bacterium]|nr:hypothetical protein [Polyangiaceae bacterium]
MVGVRDARLLQDPRVQSTVDHITVECLTTPYDRALLQCIEAGADPRGCLLSFRERQGHAPPSGQLR